MGEMMGSIEGLRDRLVLVWGHLVTIARTVVERLGSEIRRTVDLETWRSAPTFWDRLKAVSWPRAGVGVGTLAALVGGLMFVVLYDRPDAYPPPHPTARELAAHAETLRRMSHTPPPSLVEANKSWKAE